MKKKKLLKLIEALQSDLASVAHRVQNIEHNGIDRRIKSVEDRCVVVHQRVNSVHQRVNSVDHALRQLEADKQADTVKPEEPYTRPQSHPGSTK